MAENRKHKKTALRVAKKFGAKYNRGEGADIQADSVVIEVETELTVDGGLQQLQGYRRPVYIAGTNQAAVAKALEKTKGTTVGVMDNKGEIVKESTREGG